MSIQCFFNLRSRHGKEEFVRGASSARGFTLTELIAYIGLLAILLLVAFQFIFGTLGAQARTDIKEELFTSALQAMNTITSEVRQSSAVYEPTSVFDVSPGQLSLVTAKDALAGEFQTYIDFFVSDEGRLCMRKESQAVQCLTSPKVRVTDLRFTEIVPSQGQHSIQTKFTLEHITERSELRLPYTLQSSATLRGYD